MSDANRRTIAVNLDAFKIQSTRKTRKNKSTDADNKEIRVRKPKVNKSIKHNLLKFIRNRQEQRFKNDISIAPDVNEFKSDFQESLEYLSDIAKRNEVPKVMNRTIKHLEPMITNIPTVPFKLPEPKYGCLKGGRLPTFRQYTRKNNLHTPSLNITPDVLPKPQQLPKTAIATVAPQQTIVSPAPKPVTDEFNLKKSILQSTYEYKKNLPKPLFKPTRQCRKTIRRTFQLGKSQHVPKVSVLISNRTIRNQVSNRTQVLKQTPIQDVKKYLIKNGFIKVGSIAPNDVLRKMYETAMLTCGVIHNYNPENMVYNYFATHDAENE
jgi:hypothetical protein